MELNDLEWLATELPWIVNSEDLADTVVARALAKTAAEAEFNKMRSPLQPANHDAHCCCARSGMTRAAFFQHLGWEVADVLQALWAFECITLDEAIERANELSHHLVVNPVAPPAEEEAGQQHRAPQPHSAP